MKFISISVTSWNRKEMTEYCIHSILKNTPREKFELIVVDNQSTDGAIPMLRKMHHDGLIDKLYINQQDTLLGTAINMAWREADPRAEWLMSVSNDYFVMSNWFDNLNHVIKDLNLEYALAHWLIGGYKPGLRQVMSTPSGGRYLKRRKTDNILFGGSLCLRKDIYEKYNIHFPENTVNSPYSVLLKQLQVMGLRGAELAKPCTLTQDCRFNDPRYREYYKNIHNRRRRSGEDRYLPIEAFTGGYTPFVKEYYEGTNYLNEKIWDGKVPFAREYEEGTLVR